MIATAATAAANVMLPALIKEVGQPVADKVWQVISGKENQKQLGRAITLFNRGAYAVDACHKAFGTLLFGEMIEKGEGQIVFGSGVPGYIPVQPHSDDDLSRLQAIRAELSCNLHRLANQSLSGKTIDFSQFKGFFIAWEKRANDLKVITDEDDKRMGSVHELLDGQRRNWWAVYQILIRSGFGIAGAMCLIYAVLTLTGVGLGAYGLAVVWLFGLPIVQLLAIAGTGVFMLVLSQIPFTQPHVLNTCVSILEKLMQQKIKTARQAIKSKPPKKQKK